MNNPNISALEEAAKRIPHMGGLRIGSFLRQTAKTAPSGTAIVELGCWLGSGTAQMALGILERPRRDVSLHVFDNFHTSESSAAKAQRQGYDFLQPGDDTLSLVQSTLEPFGVPIDWRKGMLGKGTEWDGEPISVYVDDATKYSHTFHACLEIFGPSWVPGTTVIVLMDYYLFRKRKDLTDKRRASLRSQFDFINAHPQNFEPIADLRDSSCAAFRYTNRMDFASQAQA